MVNLRPPLSLEGRNIYHTHTSDPYCYIKPNLTGTVPVQGRQVLKSEEEESRILYTLKLQKGKVPFCLYSLPPFPPGGGGEGAGPDTGVICQPDSWNQNQPNHPTIYTPLDQ